MHERVQDITPEKPVRRITRVVKVGKVLIGGDALIVVQSMTATKTQDVEATVGQIKALQAAGAGIVRIAVDSRRDVEVLAEIRERTDAVLSVDLQENWRLALLVAPYVNKIRYNPGHLHHHERDKSVRDKVAFIADAAANHNCAIRIGVNCGSVDPELANRFGDDTISPMVESALEHCQILDGLGFDRYVVSLKDSDPKKVVEANRRFASLMPDVPLHLGVTEAGLPILGEAKTRLAFFLLLASGIGETLRVSLTVPNRLKTLEISTGYQIIKDVFEGKVPQTTFGETEGFNLISCPSCSRVENEAFVDLAERVAETSAFAREHQIDVAVMGCRVNGPGETDRADLGLWCGPTHVNLMQKDKRLGAFTYEEIIPRYKEALNRLITERGES
ncbi:4-hydroxy-3-methylbut-2-en-1-yl diphosphate synthase [Candidatus Woesebacteria bacterium]|nr:4-hydroxy-3-methylbut-2-en-1-yl diphosphate synthase [Candidatus Woesebacteria bacterium]